MAGRIDSFLAEWSAGERCGDAGAPDSLLTEGNAGIGPLRFSLTKAEWLARHQRGLRYESFGPDETGVRTSGDAAIVTARVTANGPAGAA